MRELCGVLKESDEMRLFCYVINVIFDGCCYYEVGFLLDEELMCFWMVEMECFDVFFYGWVIYEMMEFVWCWFVLGVWLDWMDEWEILFVEVIDWIRKYVVLSMLKRVDWNVELVVGDLVVIVEWLK